MFNSSWKIPFASVVSVVNRMSSFLPSSHYAAFVEVKHTTHTVEGFSVKMVLY
jgi:hypothetical protein